MNIDNLDDDILQLTKFSWNSENENIMIEWCDIAQCYKWMHMRAHQRYSTYNMLYTIPAIILSTISGTASFATSGMTGMEAKYAPMAIGAVNIFVGILTTIQQYLKITEINEGHRVSTISWDKFARNISIEISKPPTERTDAAIFFKNTRNEYDRLMETCPIIPNYIIRSFLREVGGKEGSPQRELYDKLSKPDICNTITSCRSKVYKPTSQKRLSQLDNLSRTRTLKDRLNQVIDIIKYNKIEKYIKQFRELNEREPYKEEIEDHFKDTPTEKLLEEYFTSKAEVASHLELECKSIDEHEAEHILEDTSGVNSV